MRIDKPEDVEALPIASVNSLVDLMIRDVATVRESVRPGEYDRSMSQRYLTVSRANVEGEDMGRASRQVAHVLDEVGEPPRGVRVDPRRRVTANERNVRVGRVRARCRRGRDPRVVDGIFRVAAASVEPSAPCPASRGVAMILYLTGTSLNIESFMGSIMCIGVSVSNSVMIVAFIAKIGKPVSLRRRRPGSGPGAAAADFDDRLRDDRRHGADGTGP